MRFNRGSAQHIERLTFAFVPEDLHGPAQSPEAQAFDLVSIWDIMTMRVEKKRVGTTLLVTFRTRTMKGAMVRVLT